MECAGGLAALTRMRLILISSLIFATATAETLKFSSGEKRTRLIELYSSEGCSSCPPAEAWLAGLADASKLWRDFVPVAFHVNYWDQLGWRDRFARPEFTARQRAYASEWNSDTVYTPEFVLDGQEWKAAAPRQPPSLSAEKTGILKIEYETDGACRVAFAGAMAGEVHVALLGGGIISDVRAGENQGRQLHNEFVVLALKSATLQNGMVALNLPLSQGKDVGRHALAVWVTRRGELMPVQATGGWLD